MSCICPKRRRRLRSQSSNILGKLHSGHTHHHVKHRLSSSTFHSICVCMWLMHNTAEICFIEATRDENACPLLGYSNSWCGCYNKRETQNLSVLCCQLSFLDSGVGKHLHRFCSKRRSSEGIKNDVATSTFRFAFSCSKRKWGHFDAENKGDMKVFDWIQGLFDPALTQRSTTMEKKKRSRHWLLLQSSSCNRGWLLLASSLLFAVVTTSDSPLLRRRRPSSSQAPPPRAHTAAAATCMCVYALILSRGTHI